MAAADNLEARLLRQVMDAKLPRREPIMRWLDWPDDESLKVRAWDHALLLGRCEYHCLPDGRVEVRDYTDPRSMRSQFYDPKRPGQPYMAPSHEDCNLPSG